MVGAEEVLLVPSHRASLNCPRRPAPAPAGGVLLASFRDVFRREPPGIFDAVRRDWYAVTARARRIALGPCASILVLSLMLLAATNAAANGDGQLFYYGNIIDVNPGSRVITVREDDKVRWRFLVTSETQIQRHIEHPTPATFDHLKVGLRVRILAGSPTRNPTIRVALSLFIYD